MWTSLPSNTTRPPSGAWVPATHLIRVDLPAPLSPTRAITSPGRTWKSTSVSACTEPKLFEIPRSSSSGEDVVAGALVIEDRGGDRPGRPPPLVSYLQYFAYEPRQTSDRF